MLKKMPIITIIIFSAFFTGCGSGNNENPIQGTETENNESEQKNIDVFGIVTAEKTRNISFDFGCRIKDVFVRSGETVNKGANLIELDLNTFKLEIDRLKQEMDIIDMDLKTADDEYQKNLSLSKEKAITQKTLSSSYSSWKKLESQMTLKKQEYNLMSSRLNSRYLSGSNLICLYNKGIVTEINLNPGDFAPANTRLLSIIDFDDLTVQANIPEEFIGDIHTGSIAEIVPLADRDRTYTGRITFIAHTARNQGGETIIPVLIELDEPDDFLIPNINVDIKIFIEDENT